MKKKRSFTVLFLIAAAVFIFLRGWLQLAVPEGEYGVLRSKTHGLRDKVIRGGNFDWVWYRAIPWNTTIYTFIIAPSSFKIELSGKLPLSGTLSAFTGIEGKYNWRVSGDCSFLARPESLPGLVAHGPVKSQEDFDQWLKRQADELSAWTRQRLTIYFDSSQPRQNFAGVSKDGASGMLTREILSAYPFLNEIKCSIVIEDMPDFDQWESARAVYTAYLDSQRAVLQGEVTTQAVRKIESQFRFDELTRYGELLTKYPVLLEYLKFERKALDE